MTNSFQDGFLRAPDGTLITVDEASATAPVAWQDGFLRDATGALVTTGTGGGGATTAAELTFDDSTAQVITHTDGQDALMDLDAAVEANITAIAANAATIAANAATIATAAAQAANSHGDLDQNVDGTWPANPGDGRRYTWWGSGTLTGAWQATHAYNTGDGVYVTGTGAGVYTAKTAFTSGATFSATNWNLVPMNPGDDIDLS